MPRTLLRCRTTAGTRRRLHSQTTSSIRPSRCRASAQGSAAPKPRPRFFSQKLPLSILSTSTLRPQLPFLYQAAGRPPATLVARLMSTERKELWKRRLWWNIRIQMVAWPALAIGVAIAYGLMHTRCEHEFPTPREWSFWTRWYFRNAVIAETTKIDRVLTEWYKVANCYLEVLKRLEDQAIDGKDVVRGETLVEGVGETDIDISKKSAQWKRGYYQALMGAGRAAEHMEGMATRKGKKGSKPIPWDSIPGPNNPRPKPLPWDKRGDYKRVPSEPECEDAFPQPEVFYMKILTNREFTNGERLDAALAYADFCEYRGLDDTASNMYDWAIDIAAGGLPVGSDHVVDIKTGVINQGKDQFVTQNLLKATTAMGTYHARRGEAKQALPIFLSALRARKSIPPSTDTKPAPAKLYEQTASERYKYLTAAAHSLWETPYPPLPPSGDQRPVHTLKEACEEVALMTYIGEILFSTSSQEKEKGLSWTRDSVEAAEAVMWLMNEQKDYDGQGKCRECLETGLVNWRAMIREMEQVSLAKEKSAEKSKGWFGTGLGKGSVFEQAKGELQRWRAEEAQINLKEQKIDPMILTARLHAPPQVAWSV